MQELGVKTSCRATSRYVRACREGIAAAGVVFSRQQQQWLSSSAWVGKQISTQQGFTCQVYGFYFSCYIDATASSII